MHLIKLSLMAAALAIFSAETLLCQFPQFVIEQKHESIRLKHGKETVEISSLVTIEQYAIGNRTMSRVELVSGTSSGPSARPATTFYEACSLETWSLDWGEKTARSLGQFTGQLRDPNLVRVPRTPLGSKVLEGEVCYITPVRHAKTKEIIGSSCKSPKLGINLETEFRFRGNSGEEVIHRHSIIRLRPRSPDSKELSIPVDFKRLSTKSLSSCVADSQKQ